MLRFKVRGSQGDIYNVTADRRDNDVVITCDCQAGQNGTHCHHRIELLLGDASALASDNPRDVQQLLILIGGSPLETALAAFADAEKALLAAKAARTARAKALDRLMRG